MTAWSALELRKGAGGLRHYLDGESVHCGNSLELQCVDMLYDGDGGCSLVPLPRGVVVRYEATLWHGERSQIEVTLYAELAGRTFMARLEPDMRFRWPRDA